MTGPHAPRIRPFTDQERWLETFYRQQRQAITKCCAACRKGTQTHSGGCANIDCSCHVNPPRPCSACGRVYSAPDMPFHVEQVHAGKEGSRYV